MFHYGFDNKPSRTVNLSLRKPTSDHGWHTFARRHIRPYFDWEQEILQLFYSRLAVYMRGFSWLTAAIHWFWWAMWMNEVNCAVGVFCVLFLGMFCCSWGAVRVGKLPAFPHTRLHQRSLGNLRMNGFSGPNDNEINLVTKWCMFRQIYGKHRCGYHNSNINVSIPCTMCLAYVELEGLRILCPPYPAALSLAYREIGALHRHKRPSHVLHSSMSSFWSERRLLKIENRLRHSWSTEGHIDWSAFHMKGSQMNRIHNKLPRRWSAAVIGHDTPAEANIVVGDEPAAVR